ncbi:MAG: hypothetical protein N3G21_08710 [Candidatus Hydrogenedentes bacterium]|nr:hypothetical protein [Candidatus Hydrogenedentota bacterium]
MREEYKKMIILCLITILSALIVPTSGHSEASILIRNAEVPSPSVVRIPISFTNSTPEISTLIIKWQLNNKNISIVEVAHPSNLQNGKKVISSKTGSQMGLVVYGGGEPIPNGVICEVIILISENLPEGANIQLSGIIADGADVQALPQKISVEGGKITVKKITNYHSADTSKNWAIELSELIRVIQLFNSREYHCAQGTEDGYAPSSGDRNCSPHKADYQPQDWKIQLNELLRSIQFFNFPAGSYHPDEGTEDGYAPGPF